MLFKQAEVVLLVAASASQSRHHLLFVDIPCFKRITRVS